ncbi:MAG: hypothetical protein ACYTFX_02940 [Planctomycetota bacterium]|jgi:hypothetical protein
MTSDKQLAANRRNAQKSTGPKTEEGKSVVAQNAVTHGFTATAPILPNEDPAAYAAFKSQLTKELNPAGHVENMLAERIVDLAWRLKRSGRLHIDAYRVFAQGSSGILPESQDASTEDIDCGRIAVNDFAEAKVFERLLVHERRIENSLYKTITELQRLQFIRTKYQSLLMDGVDYDDCETREILEQNALARLPHATTN